VSLFMYIFTYAQNLIKLSMFKPPMEPR